MKTVDLKIGSEVTMSFTMYVSVAEFLTIHKTPH